MDLYSAVGGSKPSRLVLCLEANEPLREFIACGSDDQRMDDFFSYVFFLVELDDLLLQ